MTILSRQDNTQKGSPHSTVMAFILRVLLYGLSFLFSSGLIAQVPGQEGEQVADPEQAPVEEIVEVVVALPGSQQMAMALATPELRVQALLDLAVAAHILSRADNEPEVGVEVDHAALAQSYLDDRAWLQGLVDRYGWVQPHSSVLDPAAWALIGELQKNNLENMPLLYPGRMPEPVLIYQVFQRSGQSLAVANLPNLLLEVEAKALNLWSAFLQLTEDDGSTNEAWKVVETAWFTDRSMPDIPIVEEPAGESANAPEPLPVNIPQAMSEVVLSAVDARPPDSRGLMELRYSILNRLAGEESTRTRARLKNSLYLISLIDGLHEGRYFDFVQGLLSITYRLLEVPVNGEETTSLVDWLVAEGMHR